ncbi:MAG: phosphatidylglycerophosphatase A [Bacteroidetes bacterium]|nr:MAG: phosphatidylglycerophosphatase A [Bacteroidota bacterium]
MKFYKITASGLGTGYSPVAPGTAGSVLGIILFWILNFALQKADANEWFILVLNSGVIILTMFIGVKAIKEVHKIWEHDAGKIVIDEIVGVWIAAFAVPFRWEYYLSALVLFRFFDILKPLYIRRLDNMKTNWSVMLDDVLAGIYALIVLQLIIYFKVF